MNIKPEYEFEVESGLKTIDTPEGKVNCVNLALPLCLLDPKKKITHIDLITRDICGNKFSKLCGFVFESALPLSEGKYFLIVYVPKLKFSSMMHAGLSGWYIWKHINFNNEMVISKDDLLNAYGFDAEKFFQSDFFLKWLPVMKKQVQDSLNTVVPEFIDTISDYRTKKMAMVYANAVQKSLSTIENIASDIKLAYNADKTYMLKNLDLQTKVSKPSADNNIIG